MRLSTISVDNHVGRLFSDSSMARRMWTPNPAPVRPALCTVGVEGPVRRLLISLQKPRPAMPLAICAKFIQKCRVWRSRSNHSPRPTKTVDQPVEKLRTPPRRPRQLWSCGICSGFVQRPARSAQNAGTGLWKTPWYFAIGHASQGFRAVVRNLCRYVPVVCCSKCGICVWG
ncbi:hypothetical protein D3C80_1232880 [compost metagenome]